MRNFRVQDVLALSMGENDADAETIGQYIMVLGAQLFKEQDCFSGKRPFGNSGWTYEVYEVLVKARVIDGEYYDDGDLKSLDEDQAEAVMREVFEYLKNLDFSRLP